MNTKTKHDIMKDFYTKRKEWLDKYIKENVDTTKTRETAFIKSKAKSLCRDTKKQENNIIARGEEDASK